MLNGATHLIPPISYFDRSRDILADDLSIRRKYGF